MATDNCRVFTVEIYQLPDGSYTAHCPEKKLSCKRSGRAAAIAFLNQALQGKVPENHPDLFFWPPTGSFPYLRQLQIQTIQ